MLTHDQNLDRAGSAGGARRTVAFRTIAKRSGLDPTTFNKSKTASRPDGRERWAINRIGIQGARRHQQFHRHFRGS